jgi:hypothetical protein
MAFLRGERAPVVLIAPVTEAVIEYAKPRRKYDPAKRREYMRKYMRGYREINPRDRRG